MAQSKDVAAMRMRIIRTGYREVKIEQRLDGYLVQAVEPLAGLRVRTVVKSDAIKWVCR